MRARGGISESFSVRIGVHQGSALSPYLFILVVDELLKGKVKEVPWCMLFADDMALIAESDREVQLVLERVREALESKGLKINREKAVHLESRWKGDVSECGRVKLEEVVLKRVGEYKYLGSVVQEDGELEGEINRKVQLGWCKFREVSAVVCDRRVPMRLKGKVYSSVVRPAMMYGAECWAIKKVQE